jgi:glycosyltransferase involved in cell wall biosynthesis
MSSPAPIAIIVNEQTPYRLNLHRRIVREIPEIELWSLFTHEVATSPWQYQSIQEIGPVLFGAGQSTSGQDSARNALREWRKGGEIVKWLSEHKIRAVVLFGYNDPARLRILLWCKKCRIPCFLFGDSNLLCERATGLSAIAKKIYVSWVIRQCQGIFHCGKLGRAYFLKYGASPARLYPFPYEPDYDLLIPKSEVVPDRLRARFNLPASRRRLLFVGRLVPVKRPDLLIDAFERIADSRPEWDLVMAGDGPLKSWLQAKIPAARVSWIGFLDNVEEIGALYSICDVLILPSDFEPWGVVVTEAATQLALVASSIVGAAADVLEDGVNGKTFKTGDLDSLTAALMDVTNPDRIEAMKSASPRMLANWRSQSDPVIHLRRALRDTGVLDA